MSYNVSRLNLSINENKNNNFSNFVYKTSQFRTNKMEKELLIEYEIKPYYRSCYKCCTPITSKSEACQVMGNMYHTSCFSCQSCSRSLKGKPFYKINDSFYCEEDYMYLGYLENSQKCYACGHVIVDKILQAIGKSYHPSCFRCVCCNECLDGMPFTIDVKNRVYCMEDFYRKYAPKCFRCKQAITPTDGMFFFKGTIRTYLAI